MTGMARPPAAITILGTGIEFGTLDTPQGIIPVLTVYNQVAQAAIQLSGGDLDRLIEQAAEARKQMRRIHTATPADVANLNGGSR